jgi:hypothetical protein
MADKVFSADTSALGALAVPLREPKAAYVQSASLSDLSLLHAHQDSGIS